MIRVPDEGRLDAPLVLIGEAPGASEEAQRRPFVGASGLTLARWWETVGLTRSDFYITNVIDWRPQANKIETVPRAQLDAAADLLHDRLSRLTAPRVVVPTGNTALRALTGKKGITKWRGSLLEYVDQRGRTLKCVPTLHPAGILRDPSGERRALRDWERIAAERWVDGLHLPVRESFTQPRLDDVVAFVATVEALPAPSCGLRADAATAGPILAIDIETPNATVVCVGLSLDPAFALVVPTTLQYWGDPRTLDQVWGLLRRVARAPVAKALQNGLFDTFYLADHDIALKNYWWDTLAMHHALDPSDDHSLAYMASVDTRQPYWKDDAKDPAEMAKYLNNWDALLQYNGLDAMVTRELAETYRTRLIEREQLGFYWRHYAHMFEPLLAMMRHGIRVDDARRRRRYAGLLADCYQIQAKLKELAGKDLHGKQDLSSKRIQWFLYDHLKLPKRTNRATGNTTANEVAVRGLMVHPNAKVRATAQEPCALILEHRNKKKLSEFLAEGVADPDGRVRCQYKFTTITGRLASSSNPRGTGRNLQNISRELRDVFLPDPGRVFLEADLSQAESRIVGALTGDAKLIDLARAAPWSFDVHRFNAAIIFQVPADDVSKEQRYLGKRAVHASNYGMQGRKLSEVLLLDGHVRTPEECQAMIERYLERFPAIKTWQQRVRMQVMQDGCLANSWGRVLDLKYERMCDDTYRQAYAFVPQSEIADLLNQCVLIPLHRYLTANKMAAKINAQIHDAVLVSTPVEEAHEIATYIKKVAEVPRRYAGVELTIPIEFKLGRSWKGNTEFKQLPAPAEFAAAATALL